MIFTRQIIVSFLVGWLILSFLGIAVSTQFVLAQLTGLGVEIPFGLRVSTTLHDMGSMLPLFGSIMGLGFLIAMPVATLIARWVKILPELVYALAGFAAVAVILISMKLVFQLTAIAAARETSGFIALCLVGALAGYVYQQLSRRIGRASAPPATPETGQMSV